MEKKKLSVSDRPTDGPTVRRTERVIESRACDQKLVSAQRLAWLNYLSMSQKHAILAHSASRSQSRQDDQWPISPGPSPKLRYNISEYPKFTAIRNKIITRFGLSPVRLTVD